MLAAVSATQRPALVLDEEQDLRLVAREELKKFFRVAAVRQGEGEMALMPECYVDTFWHSLLEDDGAYQELCLKAVGVPVDHLCINGKGILEWVPTYHELFGGLPSIWFTDFDGKMDAAAYAEYLRASEMRASWNCTPGMNECPSPFVKASWNCTPGIKKCGSPALLN